MPLISMRLADAGIPPISFRIASRRVRYGGRYSEHAERGRALKKSAATSIILVPLLASACGVDAPER
ncbi:hypothetical protein [Salininema proteolyticum]|uniref:Uncharacterized protein n=1 Tax=Salininema proteolyticum TaxID=1607685 RepID=A0ABV8TSZ5_9ACTN